MTITPTMAIMTNPITLNTPNLNKPPTFDINIRQLERNIFGGGRRAAGAGRAAAIV